MDAIKCLSDLTQLGLITPVELSEWTAKLLGSSIPAAAPAATPTPTPAPEPLKVEEKASSFTTATKLLDVSDRLR